MSDENRFYKKFKISRQNFLQDLKNRETKEEVQKLINSTIYDQSAAIGRRGVLSLSDSVEILKKKWEDK
jgi:hypothetical protein